MIALLRSTGCYQTLLTVGCLCLHKQDRSKQQMSMSMNTSISKSMSMSIAGGRAAYSVAIKARHGLHEGLHGLRPLLLGRAAYLLHHRWRQAVPVALPTVPRPRHRHGAARLMCLLAPLCLTHTVSSTFQNLVT